MFTSQLPSNSDFRVLFSDYANRHFIKRFTKDYKGKQWVVTKDSTFEDLKRIHAKQKSQQVDELKKGKDVILFKYDFAVAQTNISSKASGNRCVCFLDIKTLLITVMVVYSKGDLPKNKHETAYILETVRDNFPELWLLLD
jgi:hypothetical protein